MTDELMHQLEEAEALLADGFESALIGISDPEGRAVYDIDKMILILMTRDGMEYVDAREFIDFNVIGASMGPMQPIYVNLHPEPTVKNYYIALIDSRQPDLHMTLSYIKDLTPEQVAELDMQLRQDVESLKPQPFDIKWDFEGWFGSGNTVRVLQPRPSDPLLPSWIMALVRDPRGWNPHVTTDADVVEMHFNRIEIRHKSETITAYPLEEDPRPMRKELGDAG